MRRKNIYNWDNYVRLIINRRGTLTYIGETLTTNAITLIKHIDVTNSEPRYRTGEQYKVIRKREYNQTWHVMRVL